MAVLSDASLSARLASATTQRIVVRPLSPNAIRPASIDVRLGEHLLIRTGTSHVDPLCDDADQWERKVMSEVRHGWWLNPGVPYLGTTMEWIEVPDDLGCQLDGRSSMARLFVSLHQQAGWLDPGYTGRPTLEISVMVPTILRPGQPIGQLMFHELDRPASYPYGHASVGSRYQGDTEPQPAKAVQDA